MGMSFHCSCHQFQRTNGIPCRHIYCVWDVKPLPEHCGVMHLKMYETNYGINDAATAQFQEEMNSGKHGPIFGKDNSELKLLECTKRELTGERRKWFIDPWNEVTVLNNKYVDEASMKDLRDREEEIGPLYGFNLHEMAPPTEVTSDYDDFGQQDECTEEEEDSVGGLPEPGRRIMDGYQALVNLITPLLAASLRLLRDHMKELRQPYHPPEREKGNIKGIGNIEAIEKTSLKQD